MRAASRLLVTLTIVGTLSVPIPVASAAAPPVVHSDVGLAALSAATVPSPPPGSLISQFLANQVQNCSLICPFVVQAAVQVPVAVAALPLTLLTQLQSGGSLLSVLGATGASVSGPANDAFAGIILTDIDQVIPRTQFASEVAVVGLLDILTTAVTKPADLLQAAQLARSGLFGALTNPPGPEPPATAHNPLEVAAVRAFEIGWAVLFRAPERLLLAVTQIPDAFLHTLAVTGNLGLAVNAAVGAGTTAVSDAAASIHQALTVPIPTAPAPLAAATVRSARVPAPTVSPAPTVTPVPTVTKDAHTKDAHTSNLPVVPTAPPHTTSTSPIHDVAKAIAGLGKNPLPKFDHSPEPRTGKKGKSA